VQYRSALEGRHRLRRRDQADDLGRGEGAGGERLASPEQGRTHNLIAPTCKQPAINEEAFPDMELDKLWYWTISENGSFLAWLVDFADGNSNSYDHTDTGSVRLVRAGQ